MTNILLGSEQGMSVHRFYCQATKQYKTYPTLSIISALKMIPIQVCAKTLIADQQCDTSHNGQVIII